MKGFWPTIIALFLGLGPTGVSARLGNEAEETAHAGQQDERRLVTFNPCTGVDRPGSTLDRPVGAGADVSQSRFLLTPKRNLTCVVDSISGHFLVMTNAALFDAWAAYEPSTTGAVTDLDAIRVNSTAFDSSDRPSLLRERSQAHSMTTAAFKILSFVMGPAMISQNSLELEEEEPEIAEERLAELLDAAQALKAQQLSLIRYGLNAAEKDLMQEVSNTVHQPIKEAIKSRIRADGSNFQQNYTDDTTGYAVTSWIDPSPCLNLCLPGDGISNGTGDYDFTDSSIYTYNTFDARLATDAYADLAEPPLMQIHPLVEDGTLRLTETWQSLTQMGTFPGAKDGGEQFPLTPHWGGVTPFTLPTGSSLRSEYYGPYDEEGNLRQQWIDELTQLLDLAEQQQGGTCPRCRAESEYWELGDEFKYPPGWWADRANEMVKDLDLPVKESLQVSLAVAMAVFDAGIAAWDMKYFYDSVRPVTAINELFYGSMISDWTGSAQHNKVANLDDRNFWRPYQLRRNSSPPFPDVPSGHSAFSSSAMVVLRLILGTNVFGFVTEPFQCRFDTSGGFDGDASNGNEYTTLDFKYLSEATDAAGFSRLLGGIHMMQGNIVGLEMGTKIGHGVVGHVRSLFGEDVGDDPVNDIDSDILFGTGGDDVISVPCNVDGNSEAYGYYGDDTLEYLGGSLGQLCGQVTLFGGDDEDTFRVGDVAVIGDYEAIDTIILIRSQGTLSRRVIGDKTTVRVDGSSAVILEGQWDLSSLNIVFEEPSTTVATDPPTDPDLETTEAGTTVATSTTTSDRDRRITTTTTTTDQSITTTMATTTVPTDFPSNGPTSIPTLEPSMMQTAVLVVDYQPRCGMSELHARETCGEVCMTNADCGNGEYCWGVHENFCGSIPKRIYTNPVQSNIWYRCGADEIRARTFCGASCMWNQDCLVPGEMCLSTRSNFCGSDYYEDEDEGSEDEGSSSEDEDDATGTLTNLFEEEFEVCNECTDDPTPWMVANAKTCATFGSLITKCSLNDRWVTNNYCAPYLTTVFDTHGSHG
ncbi:hypothetical protein THAOC_03780 [Thalassiosira oceanica]|uniref:Vanadium-dependent haloperoxidase NapH1-like second helical-bundle domain-containing protein n=1 Tax=Thalassiosira oceanica TaxID=159749 RepID=K0TAJ3_THAOC|nr:hypothetical protein THAOC_03780 [Thalassiosira oceanica]|eukprot:EJK74535.1 hypothetical protein THAOC_03780 [Thalassiosira oceanica]